jgi:hypothetical protein
VMLMQYWIDAQLCWCSNRIDIQMNLLVHIDAEFPICPA